MADLGALVTIADKVFQLLQSPILKNMSNWESDLEKLNNSVSSIKDMLQDADMKPELTHGEQGWIEKLKEVLYEADDLFDEVITRTKVKELHGGVGSGKKVMHKVSRFFSSENRILVNYNTSQEVKSIQQKLDAIAKNHANYKFKIDPKAVLNRETTSLINEKAEKIIGREKDVKAVIDMLIDPNVEENVGFVVVVGIGGLGKTTLAQLVFNHDRVKSNFDKKIWACVSDQDGKVLDVKRILSDIIQSLTKVRPQVNDTLEIVQTRLQEELENKKYLLILDDVWTEDPNEWVRLKKYLTNGGSGSRVVVTTRSEKTAEVVVGNASTHSKIYKLEGLSDDYSWRLFMSVGFKTGETNDLEIIEIGKKIVKKCSNVPLAIRVVGSLLCGIEHDKWESFEVNSLSQFEKTDNQIMSMLKLSYINLEPSVKNCFKYCALFPKDFEMNKQQLISLWMAQGYIGDSEHEFLILLKRCFFQDVRKDEYGNIVSFKMHDLMHDVAQEVAGDEIIVTNSPTNILSPKLRHLYVDGGEWTESNFHKRNFRTCYINTKMNSDRVKGLVANWRCLRSLRLYVPDCENLSELIGELLHLRHLDLSENYKLRTLPNAIGKLYNLQSLILTGCYSFTEWPKYFYKLVNLRLLDVGRCTSLTYMPLGIDNLTNLVDVPHFNVDLPHLKFPVNLRGAIDIEIRGSLVSERQDVSEKENKGEGGYLEHTKNLKVVRMYFLGEDSPIFDEAVIAKLQPNRNLMELILNGYKGSEIPRWGRAHDDWATILPNLVKIKLYYCERLEGVPLLCNLKHLKHLSLEALDCLEYMEEPSAISHGSSGSKDLLFFPSLEFLKIKNLMSLKGWWGRSVETDGSSGMQHLQPPFPRLSTLIIKKCPTLTSLPPCPSLKSLKVKGSNKSLRISPGEGLANTDVELWVKEINSVGYLTTLPAHRLSCIIIKNDKEVNRLSEIEEVFKRCSSLRGLLIFDCASLTSISLEHLTNLETLVLCNLPALVDDSDDEMPWISLRHNLRYLALCDLDFQILPTGMKHLTSLQGLVILYCESLEELPEWINCLSSLHSVDITGCPKLKSVGTIQSIASLRYVHIDCPGLEEFHYEEDYSEFPEHLFFPFNDENIDTDDEAFDLSDDDDDEAFD